MLPDFPELKRTFAQKILRKFEAKRAETIHIFDEVAKIYLHEGHRLIITREDGQESEIKLKHLGVESSVSNEEYAKLTPEELGAKIETAAVEMGRKQLEIAYDEINRSVTNVVDARGETLNAQHILQCFEKIQIDFDERGQPKLPAIVTHPAQVESYKRAIQEVESTPELRKNLADIFAAKKEEWRARRVIENWLDRASELSFQMPFCQVLSADGHTVVHLTRHCGMELGKDVLSIAPDGVPCAFQLKGAGGGRITLRRWREELSAQAFDLVVGKITPLNRFNPPSSSVLRNERKPRRRG